MDNNRLSKQQNNNGQQNNNRFSKQQNNNRFSKQQNNNRFSKQIKYFRAGAFIHLLRFLKILSHTVMTYSLRYYTTL